MDSPACRTSSSCPFRGESNRVPDVTLTSSPRWTSSAENSAALVAALGPASLDREIATLDPAEFAPPLHKRSGPLTLVRG
jgi:hypothetical protein